MDAALDISIVALLDLMITEGILPFDHDNMDDKVIEKKTVFLQQKYILKNILEKKVKD